MTDIISLITGPLGAVLGMVIAAIGIFLAGRRSGAQKAETKADKATINTLREVRKHEHEAETQDDTALIDRLTRKP